MERKIGPILLSGLMIGPILGSGIILLPPMAYQLIGSWSPLAWVLIMALGALFALSFSHLAIVRPGEGGMTNAIEETLGNRAKLLASLAMITAVLAGPLAVLMTAADYIARLSIFNGMTSTGVTVVLILAACILLLRDLKVVSTFTLIVSSLIAVVLVTASVVTLSVKGAVLTPQEPIVLLDFGRCTLLLFWAIVGWEVVGNYSGQVKNIKRTMPIATGISVLVITATYLMVALAINSQGPSSDGTLVPIIEPLFGGASQSILALLITGLCFSTYLLIVGAVARLIRSLAHEHYLPILFSRKTKTNAPIMGIAALATSHLLVLFLNSQGIISIDFIVNWSNAFFMINAIVGLIAMYRVSNAVWLKASLVFLISCLTILLSFSPGVIWLAVAAVLFAAMKIKPSVPGESGSSKIELSLND